MQAEDLWSAYATTFGSDDGRAVANARDLAAPVSHSSFRARLAAASYSRAEMATVMATTLRELGYDVSAWTTLAKFTDRDRCPHCNVKLVPAGR